MIHGIHLAVLFRTYALVFQETPHRHHIRNFDLLQRV